MITGQLESEDKLAISGIATLILILAGTYYGNTFMIVGGVISFGLFMYFLGTRE